MIVPDTVLIINARMKRSVTHHPAIDGSKFIFRLAFDMEWLSGMVSEAFDGARVFMELRGDRMGEPERGRRIIA